MLIFGITKDFYKQRSIETLIFQICIVLRQFIGFASHSCNIYFTFEFLKPTKALDLNMYKFRISHVLNFLLHNWNPSMGNLFAFYIFIQKQNEMQFTWLVKRHTHAHLPKYVQKRCLSVYGKTLITTIHKQVLRRNILFQPIGTRSLHDTSRFYRRLFTRRT